MAETLHTQVGYILGITPSGTTVPTQTQVTRWLLDGSILLAETLPAKAFETKWVAASLELADSYVALPASFLKFAAATYQSVTHSEVFLVNPAFGRYLRDVGSTMYTDKVIWIEGSNLHCSETDGTIDLLYVKMPTETADIPAKFHALAIDYAVIMAKKEAQELDEASLLIQEWVQKVAALEKRYGFRHSNSQRIA